jgi:hypothetical protein
MIYDSNTEYINKDGTLNVDAVTEYIRGQLNKDEQIRFPIDSNSLATLRKQMGFQNNLTPEQGAVLGTNCLVNGIVDGYIKSRNYVPGADGWKVLADGTAEFGSATIRGNITATTGAIGGWLINSTSIKDIAGTTGLSSLVTAGDDIRFWAGSATPGSAPFYVTEAGILKAAAGTIGGWTIGATTLSATGIILDSANQRIESSNYVSGVNGIGFRLDKDALEVGNISARGSIRMATFQKDTISTVGGNLLVLAGDVLSVDMTNLD